MPAKANTSDMITAQKGDLVELILDEIVTERLEDGQLDECELTLKEVHQIEESLVKSLCGIYHARIAYPKDEREENEKNGNGKKPEETTKPESDEEPSDNEAPESPAENR